MTYIEGLGINAKRAEALFANAGTARKNAVLTRLAALLVEKTDTILAENGKDLLNAEKSGLSKAMTERLTLTAERIAGIAEGVRQVVALKDPISEVIGGETLANGLSIVKKRVPLGTIGIIFESRPNVTVDAAALCLKSGNVCILRGGSDAINSNTALVEIIRQALAENSLPENAVQLVTDTSREAAAELMRLNAYVDVLIPRGGKGLIQSVMKNSTIPVIQTGEGNCHLFVDESADLGMALKIADNAKTQRPSVCNAIESLLVHEAVAAEFLPRLKAMWEGRVEILGDCETASVLGCAVASEIDFATEFNDYKITVAVVKDLEHAIEHINKFGTKHSEAIVTKSFENARLFQERIDAAAVYVNASTRFTDGFEFGLGAEIGISTQKLHARGPMGLRELTTYKYIIDGNGQIR